MVKVKKEKTTSEASFAGTLLSQYEAAKPTQSPLLYLHPWIVRIGSSQHRDAARF
jgi:hypothetical protein